jgi:hypothetical protein
MPEKTIQEEAGLPSNWQPLDVAPMVPSQIGAAPTPSPVGNYYTGGLSGILQHDVQLVDTQYSTPRISSTPLMPLSFSGLASANSAAQSISKSVSQQVINQVITENGSGVLLQTNGFNNSVQNKLDLQNGTGGIVITSGSGGSVVIAQTEMIASGPTHQGGSVPDPGPIAGITKFLREDATYQVPPNIALENNSSPNSSQTILNLIAGSGATITDGGSGNITIAATGSTNPAVVQQNDAPFVTNVVIGTTPTTIIAITATAPSSGGPFRALISYSTYFNFTGFSTVDGFTCYVSDGSHTFAGYSGGQSAATNGGSAGASCCVFSPVTYANSTTVTFTLYGVVFTGGGATAKQNSIQSGPGSFLQASFLTSV